MNWKQEMELLNDDQLKRIAFAEKESWGWGYNRKFHGGKCCIIGHIIAPDGLEDDVKLCKIKDEYQKLIVAWGYTPLEAHYMAVVPSDNNITNWSVIEEIQDFAKQLLENRTKRITQEIEVEA